MDKEAFDNYLAERYQKQMEYYSKASAKNQRRYKFFQWLLIVLSALTPVFAALNNSKELEALLPAFFKINIIVVVVSSIVAILTTGLKTFNYHELWVTYRSTYEKLKPEILGRMQDAALMMKSLNWFVSQTVRFGKHCPGFLVFYTLK